MKSMTGFGSSEASACGRKLVVEISSINSKKGLDLQFNLPRELASLENALRTQVQQSAARGRITVEVAWRAEQKDAVPALQVNTVLLGEYRSRIRAAAKSLKVEGEATLDFLLKLPGVMEDTRGVTDPGEFLAPLTKTLTRALAAWDKSREREGDFLARDLAAKFRFLAEQADGVEERKGPHLAAHRSALFKRIEEAGIPVALDDERLLKEVALFADRSDISEELTRLRAHFKEAARLLKSPEPAGRNLDFLLQEIGREINTIGSKGNDVEISRRVVAMKTELEKIREQVQNLE
ncbi:MAG: YicC/YloC family endoribonuclease [Candidatus Methylacidiphilales bacterium]|nr:YicC/YloC family endoribonuclease [Candidatus Methylacidiphilales bacterium]